MRQLEDENTRFIADWPIRRKAYRSLPYLQIGEPHSPNPASWEAEMDEPRNGDFEGAEFSIATLYSHDARSRGDHSTRSGQGVT